MIEFSYNSHNDFINYLFSIKDDKFRDFSSKIANSNYPLIGVKLPILKELAKEISKTKLTEYFNNCTFTYFEEVMVYGFLIKYLKNQEEIVKVFKIFVEKIDSWSFTDSIIASLKIVKDNREYFKGLLNYLFCDKEFYIRSAYVFLLNYYLNDENNDYVFEKLNLEYDYYYVNMAKAWLLSVAYIKYPKRVINYLKTCKNNFIVNKTISKVKDSFRVSLRDKQILTEYKR